MKILHVLYSGLGGHGNVFFSMVDADMNREFEYEALFNGVENVREEYSDKCLARNIKWDFVKKRPGLDMGFYKKLITSIKRSKPDIIFLHGSSQVMSAKIASVLSGLKSKVIVRETQANHLKTKQDWFWLAMALIFSNKTVFLSDVYDREIHKKFPLFYRKRKTVVIPNGLDLKQYNMMIKPMNRNIIIGMQSRIVKIKDHKTLLQAIKILINDDAIAAYKILLKIAGDGDCLAGLKLMAEELGISENVEFTGMLPETELIFFLKELDIYIHASFGETMSTAIMQAMAVGKPVIASDVAGINNMITNAKNGILVPVEDSGTMYEKIKELILFPEIAGELAINAGNYAQQNFSSEIMFSKYKTLFNAS